MKRSPKASAATAAAPPRDVVAIAETDFAFVSVLRHLGEEAVTNDRVWGALIREHFDVQVVRRLHVRAFISVVESVTATLKSSALNPLRRYPSRNEFYSRIGYPTSQTKARPLLSHLIRGLSATYDSRLGSTRRQRDWRSPWIMEVSAGRRSAKRWISGTGSRIRSASLRCRSAMRKWCVWIRRMTGSFTVTVPCSMPRSSDCRTSCRSSGLIHGIRHPGVDTHEPPT